MDNTSDSDLNYCFSGCESLLMHAVFESNVECVKILLAQGVDVNYQCSHGMSALLVAIKMESYECAAILMENGADGDKIFPVRVDSDRVVEMTPLIAACQLNSPHMVELLLKAGINIDRKMPNGLSALIEAIDVDSKECIELLLQYGGNPNIEMQSQTALMMATMKTNIEVMKLLIHYGGDLDVQDCQGITALMLAARTRNVECVQVLIRNGANVNMKEKDSFHALMIAQCFDDNDASVSLLIRAGSLVNLKNEYSETPLCFAIDNDREVIFDQLLSAGADVNQLAGDGCTPLWYVVNSYEKIGEPEKYMRSLLQRGGNPNIGRYPALTYAARYSYVSLVEMLLQAGANVDAVDPEFGTLLLIAGYVGSEEMLQIAWNCNARINVSAIEPGNHPKICDDNVLTKLYASGQSWSFFESGDIDVPRYLKESRSEPSLKNCCRQVVRKCIIESGRKIDLFREIPLLCIPVELAMYLLYDVTI